MSRELIFRQWDKEYKEFREFDLNKNPLQWLDFMNSLALPSQLEQECIWDQFTGLRDCNGKMIFENDVVKIDSLITGKTHVCDVIFIQEFACFMGYAEDGGTDTFHHYLDCESVIAIQVIGNVHEGVRE